MMENYRYLFKFFYIGKKKYSGSQRQKDFLTIEDCLIEALENKGYIDNIKTSRFEVASRTDKLVSARGAAFSLITKKKPILMEINTALPPEIGVWAYSVVPLDFFSRFNAIQRHYRYIYTKNENIKIRRINFKVMRRACKQLEGTHDFINFSKKEKSKTNTIRTIDLVKITSINDLIIFDFKSRAFLRQQIRRMVKKILDLGLGIIDYDQFFDMLNTSIRYSYQPADPRGLILWDIIYGKDIEFKIDIKSRERMLNFFSNQERRYNQKYNIYKLLNQSRFS
ncbi:MAG: tRNA pseudouridine(38-40) synthase TruA [Candidatus Hermodarchaeota archaeon]